MPKPTLSFANPFQNNAQDALTNPGKLFSDYGFDSRGDNETNTMLGMSAAQLYPRVASQIGFGNEMEGNRQALLRNAMQAYSPQAREAQGERIRSRGYNAALANAPQADFAARQLGLDVGGKSSAVQSGFQQANQSANDYLSYLGTPEGQQEILQLLLQLINEGQTSDLDQILALQGPLEANSQYKQANVGSGSILNGLGGVIGMAAQGIDWGKLIKGKSGGWQYMAGGAKNA